MNARTQRTIVFNRRNILDAADKLFCKNGVYKTTMDQIAQEAGYSKPTLYGYFKDKEEVYFALVLEFMQKIADKIDKVIAERVSFYDTFTKICREVYRLATRYPLYFEGLIGNINVNVQAADTPQIYKDIYILGETLNEKLIDILQQGKDEDAISSTKDNSAILLFLWSSVSGVIRMINLKKDYLKLLKLSETDFSNFCFENLLCA
ncbi:MAG: TetR/AcrR family transcriptional regulator, partial [Clostridia bacterium]|nr:TetR/AcrR family transcriptional regulator [Clostridia bacterium]